jgi:hypothetical protein
MCVYSLRVLPMLRLSATYPTRANPRLFRSPLVGSAQAPHSGSVSVVTAPKFGNNLLHLWVIPLFQFIVGYPHHTLTVHIFLSSRGSQ